MKPHVRTYEHTHEHHFSCICFYLLIFFKIYIFDFFMNTIRAKVSNTGIKCLFYEYSYSYVTCAATKLKAAAADSLGEDTIT